MFDKILGNAPIKAYLQKAVREDCLPHSLLFSGVSGIGKSLFARALAAQLLQSDPARIGAETHPDFHPIRPEGKSGLYAIETLRHLIDEVHATPFEAPAKVFLLYEAERMQTPAANALLKILEEPNPDTTLILLTSSPRDILPTIASRCTRLSFQPLSEQEIALLLREKGHAERFAKLSHGSVSKAIELATRPCLEEPLFQLLSKKPSYPELSAALEKIEELAEDEDPLAKANNAEQLISAIFIWYRDQHLQRLGLNQELLFFPEEAPVSCSLPSLEAVQKSLEEVRLAFARNMKLSVCLEKVFLGVVSK